MREIIYTSLVTCSLLYSTIELQAQNFSEIKKIVASDRSTYDSFGYSISTSGNFTVVGAYQNGDDLTGADFKRNAGSAYIYERNIITGDWSELQKIIASDRDLDDRFGFSVAISGNYLIVGAYWEDEDEYKSNTLSSAGSAYIFERDTVSGLWSEIQKIRASDRAVGDYFGRSVSINGDYAIVGAYGKDIEAGTIDTTTGQTIPNPIVDVGCSYIFERNNTTGKWSEVKKIVAFDRQEKDNYGRSVSIWGNSAIVGANRESHNISGSSEMTRSGSVYFYEKNTLTGEWSEIQKAVASDRTAEAQFGTSVSLHENRAAIGSPFGNGSVYIFDLDSNTGKWSETQNFTDPDPGNGNRFGYSVSIFDNLMAVGAYKEDEDDSGTNTLNDAGGTYIFRRDKITGMWSETQKIVASDRGSSDNFGKSVAISDNGLFVGANFETEDASGSNTLTKAGSVYFFNNSTITSDENINSAVEINLFPNPTSGVLYFKGHFVNDISHVVIRDIKGKEQPFVSRSVSFVDVSNLDVGVYFIEFKTKNGVAFSQFVKLQSN